MLKRYKQSIRRFELIPSSGGCFEVSVGGKLIYSKRQTGKFPDEATMVAAIGEALGA